MAAVLIPTFANLINKANESADLQTVKNLNTILASEQTVSQKKPSTMSEVLEQAESGGYVVDRLSPTSEGNDILWEQYSNRFVLADENGKIIFKDDLTEGETADDYNFWKIIDSESELKDCTFSVYLSDEFDAAAITHNAGVDVGENTGISVTYESEAERDNANDKVIIRTNGGDLVVKAENSTVYHFDSADTVEIDAVAGNSYHEFGKVEQNLSVENGRVVFEKNSEINGNVVIPETATGVAIQSITEQSIFIDNQSTANVKISTSGNSGSVFVSGNAENIESDGANIVKPMFVSDANSFVSAMEGGNANIVLNGSFTIPNNVTITIPEGNEVILDLAGYTVTYATTDNGLITNNGSLTINDSSKGRGAFDVERRLLTNNGYAVINGGKYTSHSKTGGTILFNEIAGTLIVNDCYIYDFWNFAIANGGGTVIINGGEIHSISSNEISGWCYAVRNEAGHMEVNGGEIYGIQGALAISGGTAVINDVHCETEEGNPKSFYALYIAGEYSGNSVIVNGGTFIGGYRNAVLVGNKNDGGIGAPAAAVFNGGTFTGAEGSPAVVVSDGGDNDYGRGMLQVTGGDYSSDMAGYCAYGYTCVREGDRYIVKAE